MIKTAKTIGEVTHDHHDVISFEPPLYQRLLDITNLDSVRDERIAILITDSTQQQQRGKINYAQAY